MRHSSILVVKITKEKHLRIIKWHIRPTMILRNDLILSSLFTHKLDFAFAIRVDGR